MRITWNDCTVRDVLLLSHNTDITVGNCMGDQIDNERVLYTTKSHV